MFVSGFFRKALALLVAILFVGQPILVFAAAVTSHSVILSREQTSVSTNFTIQFTTPTGVDASTDTITFTFGTSTLATGFNLSSLVAADVGLTHGATGVETADVVAASAAAGVWGAAISGQVLTLTAPTNAAAGTIAAGNVIIVKIGTHITGGVNQITTPSVPGSHFLNIAGTFGDSGGMMIPIFSTSDTVSISASVSSTATTTVVTPPIVTPPIDTIPPSLTGIAATNITTTGATIGWETGELSDGTVEYGMTSAYGSSTSLGDLLTVHSFALSQLLPDTTYHYRVSSRDSTSNLNTSDDHTFRTQALPLPPVISRVRVESITDRSAVVLWDTSVEATGLVTYGATDLYGSSVNEGATLRSHQVSLSGLTLNTTYHFKVASTGLNGLSTESGDATFRTLGDITAPSNVADFQAIAGDARITLSWTPPTDADLGSVAIVRSDDHFPTSPTDGRVIYRGMATSTIDTGLVNGTHYRYTAFAFDSTNNFSSGAFADAIPVETILPPTTTSTPPIVPPGPGGGEATTTIPVIPVAPTSTTPIVSVVLHPVFYASAGAIELALDAVGRFGIGTSRAVLVQVPVANLGAEVKSGTIRVGDSSYALTLAPDGGSLSASFLSGRVSASVPVDIELLLANKSSVSSTRTMVVQSYGRVMESVLIGTPTKTLADAVVAVYQQSGDDWIYWDGSRSLQSNPFRTSDDGLYGFAVPNGTYRLQITKDGYDTVEQDLTVGMNWIGTDISLNRTPKKLAEIISSEKSVQENIQSVINEAGPIAQAVVNSIQSKEAKVVAKSVLLPTAISFAVANTATAVSAFHLLNYLQFLATQPILLFGRRRRKKWGIVYNSLTKQPIQLAVVRLVFAEKNLLVQTRITDVNGRFSFIARPGKYRIEVIKPGHVFPTQYLKTATTDVDFLDLYHGEVIDVKEGGAAIAVNIPLDPVAFEETPKKILFKKSLRRIQDAMGWVSVLVTLIALAISPSWIVFGFFVLQIGLHFLFKRLATAPKPKEWGIVYDGSTRSALERVVVRIFDKQFNKLLETQITDKDGKYGFFVGKNIYYLTAEKNGYERFISPEVDLREKEEAVIDQHITLKKKE